MYVNSSREDKEEDLKESWVAMKSGEKWDPGGDTDDQLTAVSKLAFPVDQPSHRLGVGKSRGMSCMKRRLLAARNECTVGSLSPCPCPAVIRSHCLRHK